MAKAKRVVQKHHISYDPEITVNIYKGEHWLCTQLQRRKYISKGFVKTLRVWLALNGENAVEVKHARN
ncbi:MAG: hypothetical protein CMI54_03515 [Parcubacteria group bacterium]|jgi:hypothetical protein|nr:hypothetical protein [Parcubacteria group bacterium]|tara:strand:- start:4351 stop:4554 length:204 start_codon:yes stop_codon:yes gene_type:complete